MEEEGGWGHTCLCAPEGSGQRPPESLGSARGSSCSFSVCPPSEWRRQAGQREGEDETPPALVLALGAGGWHHFKSCRPQPCAQLWTPPVWLGKRWLSPCRVNMAVASGRPSVEVSTQWGPCGHPSGGRRPQCLCSPFSGTGVEVDTSSSCPPLDRRHPHPKVCVQGAEEDTHG